MANIVRRIEQRPGIIYMERPGYYFGYGSEADPDVMDAILGRSVVAELGVKAVRLQLVLQRLQQINATPHEELGGKSAQELLRDTWGESFSAHVLRAGDQKDTVWGTLYEIGMDDAEALAYWNIAGPQLGQAAWKYWDHGIELSDGRLATTLNITHDQEVDGDTAFLNASKPTTLSIIREEMNTIRTASE